MNDEGLAGLRDKYREMLRLRDEDQAGMAGDPKPLMAVLAARFPGALRQIDRLPRPILESRLSQLDAALAGATTAASWARLEIAYHGRMRAVLRVKSAVRGVIDDGEALRRATDAWAQEPDEPTEPMNTDRLASIREPPGGRLNPAVFSGVAADHGVTVEDVRAALFPPSTSRPTS